MLSKPPDTGGILAHAQAVDTRPTSLSEVRPGIEASFWLGDFRFSANKTFALALNFPASILEWTLEWTSGLTMTPPSALLSLLHSSPTPSPSFSVLYGWLASNEQLATLYYIVPKKTQESTELWMGNKQFWNLKHGCRMEQKSCMQGRQSWRMLRRPACDNGPKIIGSQCSCRDKKSYYTINPASATGSEKNEQP